MQSSLLPMLRANAAGAGLNLLGLVDRARFDAGEPKERRVAAMVRGCDTIVVLASAGRWVPPAAPTPAAPTPTQHPVALAAWADAGAMQVAAVLRASGTACSVITFRGACRVNAARLGEAAGFGTVSPVAGLLLHPEFGPWLRVRAAVLCEGHPFGPLPEASIAEQFQPCCSCSRPCVSACPASVHDGLGHHDLAGCASHRDRDGCTSGCASRLACPLGSEHRDRGDEDTHRHTFELTTMRRWFGIGVWRFVPKPMRGGL